MIKNILVFSFSFIGDATLSTAVINPLRRHFPDAQISLLVGTRAFHLLAEDPGIDYVLIYDHREKHAGWNGKWRLISSLRSKRFDLIIDLRDSLWSRFLGGVHWGLPRRGSNTHAVTRYLEALKRHGVDTAGARPQLRFTDGEITARDQYLINKGMTRDRPVVGIHPGGNWRYKLWSPTNFARIADLLDDEWDAQILLFAGPDELSLQVQVADSMNLEPIVVKNQSLRQVAALIETCDIYIGNDTGPMHIAAAVGTSVIAIFGSTNHHRSGPYGEEHIVVRSDMDLGCNPCHPGKNPGSCGAESCAVIDAITVQQVFQRLKNARSSRIQ
ncbi:MAG: glycosyltransferase family 9 protein [Candidatus Poribacteria bacterium]|nr:glycosyltransferase family 9 protein [Candidatus Poribacteria bacterium]MDE0505405.1 glycosyltransferase family 9 protein [Candidatus Poribacteria bacterium]